MKNVLITIDYYPSLGGVATYYSKLKKYWPESDLKVMDNTNNALLAKSGCIRWRRAFFRILKNTSKDNYLIAGQILPIGTVCFLLNILKKRKYAVVLHGMDFKSALRKKRKKFLSMLVLKRADKIICGNNYTVNLVKDFLIKEKHKNKVKVVNPGIDLEDFNDLNKNILEEETEKLRNKYNLENKFILLSLGRLVKRKGFDKTLEALSLIDDKKDFSNDKYKSFVYIVAGKGEELGFLKEEAKKIKNKKIEILFIEDFDDNIKWQLYNLSDVFIMPSREINGDFEGFGIVYLEANIFEKSVIAGRSGGVEDAVKDNLNGVLVDPEKEEDIKRAILKLYNNNDLRMDLGKRGRERAISEFSWEKQSKLFYNYVNK